MTTTAVARPLRDYQTTCIDLTYRSILESWEHGTGDPCPGCDGNQPCCNLLSGAFSAYYTLPTGTGKTRIATGLIEKLSQHGRVLVVAHRKELIEQMAAAIREDTGLQVGVQMASYNEYKSQVTVGSIQTLRTERLERLLTHPESATPYQYSWEPGATDPLVAVLIDECHHVTPQNSYGQLVNQVRSVYPQCAVIGCTATPYRADKQVMQQVLPTCTFSRSIPDMQEAGWLAPVSWCPIRVNMNTAGLKTSSVDGEKDYQVGELEAALDPHLQRIVEQTVPLLEERPTVVFAPTVKIAMNLAELFQRAGIVSCAIWGDMAKPARDYTLAEWKAGRCQLVVNVGILTEGFDYVPAHPNTNGLSCLVIARPTLSPSLYLQMLGRGTRLKPGSAAYHDCLVLDVVGNANLLDTKQISLPRVMPAFAEDDLDAEPGKPRVPRTSEHTSRPAVLKINDPLKVSWAAWGQDQQTGVYHCSVDRDYLVALVPDPRRSGLYYGFGYSKDGSYQWYSERVTDRPKPLTEMMQHLNLIFAKAGAKHLVDKEAAWRREPASQKQLSFLYRLDENLSLRAREERWTKGEVSVILNWKQLEGPVLHTLAEIGGEA